MLICLLLGVLGVGGCYVCGGVVDEFDCVRLGRVERLGLGLGVGLSAGARGEWLVVLCGVCGEDVVGRVERMRGVLGGVGGV